MELVDVFKTNGIYKFNPETCEFFKFGVSKYSNKKPIDGCIKLNTSISRGYVKVLINSKRVAVHRIIMQSLSESENEGLEVNHIDGNKLNNHYSNLEWCTSSENKRHAFRVGLRGGRQSCVRKDRKLSDEIVIDIKKMIKAGFSNSEIQKKHGIKPNTFHYIKNGRNYSYIKI